MREAELFTALLLGQTIEGVDERVTASCFLVSSLVQLKSDGSGLRVSLKSVSAAVTIVQACSHLGNLDFSSNRGSTSTGYLGTQVGSLDSFPSFNASEARPMDGPTNWSLQS